MEMVTAFLIAINLTFTWSPTDDLADNFKLYVKEGIGEYAPLFTTPTKDSTATLDVPFTEGVKKCFQVTAVNIIGESSPSNEVCLGKPSAPTTLIVRKKE